MNHETRGPLTPTLRQPLERLNQAVELLRAPTADNILSAATALEQASISIQEWLGQDRAVVRPGMDDPEVAQIVQSRWLVNQLLAQIGVALETAQPDSPGGGTHFDLEI